MTINTLFIKGLELNRFFTVRTEKVFTGYGWRGKNDEIITLSLEDAMNNKIETADLEKKYKVVRKEEKFNDIPILAESEEDFHFILEREAKRLNVPIEIIAEHQPELLKNLWEDYRKIYKSDNSELNAEFLKNQVRVDRFLAYCKKVIAPSENPEDVVSQNFNYRIFTSEKGQSIFDEWHELHKANYSTHLADYSFIFRSLEKDGFIQFGIRGTQFIDFLEDYNISIGKLKTFNKCNTTKRINLYNTIKIAIR